MKSKAKIVHVPSKKKVFVGMSGGVDSSVAAYLLKKQGYDVVGVFMRSYNVDGCAERDAEDARRVAEHIGIPFYALDFEAEYKKRVVDYMVAGYRAGLTPNPDIMCNKEIKFGIFLEKALAMGADYIATGHYVRNRNGKLFAAEDKNKDQSYFLWTLTPAQLKHCLFPVGGYLKPAVRAMARKAGLPTAEKKDSQGICFLGQVSIEEFLATYIPEKKGAVVTPDGEVVGEHRGAHLYTVGQRKIGVNYRAARGSGSRPPFYVSGKDIKSNTVTVVAGGENQALFRKELALGELNWNGGRAKEAEVMARVRYRQPLSPAKLSFGKSGTAKIIFEKPQQFVAEGQSAVFYSKSGEVLGGAIIK
jgi:tRNA-specific 2-thiouridylase